MTILYGLLLVAGLLSLVVAAYARAANANPTQKHIARLLLICGRAFSDRNEELYLLTIREIINIMRNERWSCAKIESGMRHALTLARASSSPENFEKAQRLAQNLIYLSRSYGKSQARLPMSRMIARSAS